MSGFRSRTTAARTGRDTPAPDGGQRSRRGAGMDRGYNRRSSQDRTGGGARGGREDRPSGPPQTVDRPRQIAYHLIREIVAEDGYANLLTPRRLREAKAKRRDAAFVTEVVYGTMRTLGLLDAIIADAAKRPVTKIDAPVLDILRMGTYQIIRMDVDDYAAVDTSVNLARTVDQGQAVGFINGVLRSITRRSPESWLDRVAGEGGLDSLALRHAHPSWIAAAFAESLGVDPSTPAGRSELRDCLIADDARPLVHLVARPGAMSGEELALTTGTEEGRYSPFAAYLDGGDPHALEPVAEGLASVQDEGSQLIALATVRTAIDVPEASATRWMDLCSGPGGKSAFIASWGIADGAHVDAVEVAAHRADLVRSSCEGLPVTVTVGDGRSPELLRSAGLTPPDAGYGRVLVDAPCSGLGALRRRPEARWRKSPQDIPELVSLQRDLLRTGLALTAPGGVTIYSTCSPHLDETRHLVASIIAETGAELLDLREVLPELPDDAFVTIADADSPGTTHRGAVQLWPHRHGTDGMFFAALRPAASAEAAPDAAPANTASADPKETSQ